LLHKFAAYVNWFHSYLTNRLSCVHYSGALSQPFGLLSGVPQKSVLGPLIFNVFINDLCNVIKFSNYLLFADDIKICWAVKTPHGCSLLQMDIGSICDWCTSNYMKINVSKTRVISFPWKTNMISFGYKLCGSRINHTDTLKDLGIILDTKLYFHPHVDYIFSQALHLLGLIRVIIFSFSSIDSLLMLYFTLVRSKLEYASVAWNTLALSDANKLEHIQH
jgi:hypothetical protein